MKKKISIIHPFFTQYGGAEKVVLDMAKHFTKRYGECNLYTSVLDKQFEKIIKGVKGLNVIALKQKVLGKSIFGNKFNPFLVIDMLRLSRKIKKSDFIITTNWPSNIATYLSKKFFNNKNADSLYFCLEPDHGLHHKKMATTQYLTKNPVKLFILSAFFLPFSILDKFMVNREKIILTYSKHIKEKVKKVFGEKAYKRTYAILHDYIVTKIKPTKRYKSKEIIFFSICRLEKSKNVDMIVNAFKKLYKKHKNTKLIIAGKGPEENKLKKLAKDIDAIKFLGFVSDKELSSTYANTDIFVFAGTSESAGPLTLIDAMDHGNAVVVPNEGGPIEVIEDGKDGIIFKAHSIWDLYEKMRYLLENKKLRERLGKNAKRNVASSFSSEHYFSNFYSVIEHPERFQKH